MKPELLGAAIEAVRDHLTDGRMLVGLAGPPAAGKSTLATALANTIPGRLGCTAVAVPMDGFHLANAELRRLGRIQRKGAPDTFDAHGFVHLLRRLRAAEPGETVYAPTFDRGVNESIGSAIPVDPGVRVVVVEGNYLLYDEPPWHQVRDLLDLALYVDAPTQARFRSLVHRHVVRGLDSESAHAFVTGSDEVNARLIAGTRGRADLILTRG